MSEILDFYHLRKAKRHKFAAKNTQGDIKITRDSRSFTFRKKQKQTQAGGLQKVIYLKTILDLNWNHRNTGKQKPCMQGMFQNTMSCFFSFTPQ